MVFLQFLKPNGRVAYHNFFHIMNEVWGSHSNGDVTGVLVCNTLEFVSSFSQSTHLDVMWNKLWCTSGKCNQTSILGIPVGSIIVTSQASIANTIISSCSSVCNSDNCDYIFRVLKDDAKTVFLQFSSWVVQVYNADFNIDELLTALEHYCNISPGPNSVPNRTGLPSHMQAGCSSCACTVCMDRELGTSFEAQ
jgi:hypothetical protein